MNRFLPIALLAAISSLPALADPNPGIGPPRGDKAPPPPGDESEELREVPSGEWNADDRFPPSS